MAALFLGSKFSATDANGNPLAAGRVYTYAAGTLTPKATYTTQVGDVANANPVILDSAGRANIWLGSGAYKFVVQDSTGAAAPDGTVDNVTAPSLEVVADLANASDVAKGDALIAVSAPGGASVATTQHEINGRTINVFDFLTVAQRASVQARDLSQDVTAALQAAIDAAGNNSSLVWPAGHYRTSATLIQNYNRQRWECAGRGATRIDFAPTANDTCLQIGTTAGIRALASIGDMEIYSSDSAFTKVGIELIDTDITSIERVNVAGSVVAGSTLMWSGANSIGVLVRGRDHGTLGDMYIAADRPIVIRENPSSVIDLDNFVFRDHYLIANANPVVEIENFDAYITQVKFLGRHSWNLGTAGFRWINTLSAQSSAGLVFEDIRTEQGTDASAYSIQIEMPATGPLQGLEMRGCYMDVTRKGLKLRNVTDVDMRRQYYVGTGEAFNIDSTVKRVSALACFWQAGATATVTGQRFLWSAPKNPNTAPLPPSFFLDESANAAKNVAADVATAGTSFTLANNATLALGANIGGMLSVVTSEGFGASFLCHGSQNLVDFLGGATATAYFSNTLTTASKVNVGFTGGQYTIENKRGSTLTLRIFVAGAYGAVA